MNLEKDYVYLYQPGGNFHNPVLRFRSPAYVAEISSEGKLGLSRFGFTESKDCGFSDADFLASDEIRCDFRIIKKGKILPCTGTRYCYESEHWYWCAPSKFRIVEAGRFFNKVDMMDMLFRDKSVIGRFEMTSLPEGFVLKFDGYCKEVAEGGAEFSVTFPKTWRLTETATGVRAEKGGRFLGITALNAVLSLQENTVTFSNRELGLSDAFSGVTACFYIDRDCAPECKVKILSHNQDSLRVSRMPDYGVYRIDMQGNENLDFNIAENRNKYDRVSVAIENDGDEERGCLLCFAKEGEQFPITGMSPVWRDIESGEPNGVPVQITKDWHIHPDERECGEWFAIPLNAPRRYLEGKWSHLYSYIKLQPHATYEGEFVCSFENWGSAPAVSHAQLSLIGWGGYDVWEQLAVGSHGENICFQADTSSQSVSFINDVRPLYTRGRHGGFRSYDWSDNVGGGELLVYYDKEGNRIEFTDIFRDFRAQCPVLSEAAYSLKTKDGKIAADLTINNVRTDDVLKIYFNIDYRFLKDTEYSRLALFQFDTDRYQANLFRKMAHGDGDTVLEDIALEEEDAMQNGYNPRYARCKEAGKEPWFYFYDQPEARKGDLEGLSENARILAGGKNSTVLIAVRSYRATINGEVCEAKYSIRQCYSTDIRHQSVEINPYLPEGTIAAGSRVSMCVEFVCIPSSLESYYGNCKYLLEGESMLDTPACALYQVTGDRLLVRVERGILKQAYPLVFECVNNCCAFTLQGGLGYVPVRFENLSDYRGFELLRDGRKIDQSIIGNDFWQTDYNADTGTYSLSFSVPNEGTSLFELRKKDSRK